MEISLFDYLRDNGIGHTGSAFLDPENVGPSNDLGGVDLSRNAFRGATGINGATDDPRYKEWVVANLPQSYKDFLNKEVPGADPANLSRILPNGNLYVPDSGLASNMPDKFGIEDAMMMAGMAAVGSAGAWAGGAAGAGAAGAAGAEAGGLSAGAGLTEAGWGAGVGGLGGDAAGLVSAGGGSLLGAGAEAVGGLDASAGLTEAGWNMGPAGLGGDAAGLAEAAGAGTTAGGAFDMGGMAGMESALGIGGAGMGAVAGTGAGVDALTGGAFDMGGMGTEFASSLGAGVGGGPTFSSGGGMNADAFGNFDMGYGSSGTEGFSGGDVGGGSLTDVPPFPSPSGDDKSKLPGDIMDKALKFGPLGLGVAGLLQQRAAAAKLAEANKAAGVPASIGGVGAPQREIASQMLADAQAGRINVADQFAIDQWAKDAIAKSRAYFAKAGISDSTMATQSEADINAKAAAMKEQARQTLLKTGLETLNVVDKYTTMAVQAEMAGDQAMAKQATDFLGSYGQWLRSLPAMTGQASTGTKAAVPA